MIVVIAHYRTRPEHVDTVRSTLCHHAAASAQEPGCVSFRAHQSCEDPTRFALYEVYTTAEAFEEDRRTRHFRDNIESLVAPLLVERSWSTYAPHCPDAACEYHSGCAYGSRTAGRAAL